MIAIRVIEQPSSCLLLILTSIVTDHLALCMIALLFGLRWHVGPDLACLCKDHTV
jgi:hypothetical protein